MITRRIFSRLMPVLFCTFRAHPATAAEAQVSIDNFAFVPARLVVPGGTAVRFTNHDDIPHTIVHAEGDQSFRSPVLDTDDSFAHTFATRGRFAYFCSLHPHMQGEIEVT